MSIQALLSLTFQGWPKCCITLSLQEWSTVILSWPLRNLMIVVFSLISYPSTWVVWVLLSLYGSSLNSGTILIVVYLLPQVLFLRVGMHTLGRTCCISSHLEYLCPYNMKAIWCCYGLPVNPSDEILQGWVRHNIHSGSLSSSLTFTRYWDWLNFVSYLFDCCCSLYGSSYKFVNS